MFKRITLSFLFISLVLFTIGCTSTTQKWEYKIISFPNEAKARSGTQAINPTSVTPSEPDLNNVGAQGWELVDSYLEMETAYPNFGSESYVTGIQPNVRPQRLVCILKRQVKDKQNILQKLKR